MLLLKPRIGRYHRCQFSDFRTPLVNFSHCYVFRNNWPPKEYVLKHGLRISNDTKSTKTKIENLMMPKTLPSSHGLSSPGAGTTPKSVLVCAMESCVRRLSNAPSAEVVRAWEPFQ